MKTKKIILGIAVPSLILVTIAVGAVILGLVYFGNRETVPKEAYAEYVCRDSNLQGKERGKALWGYRNGIDVIKYWKIKGVSEKDFVYVTVANYMNLGGPTYVVQSPENTTDVLREWHIKSISFAVMEDIHHVSDIVLEDKEVIDELTTQLQRGKDMINCPTSIRAHENIGGTFKLEFEESKCIEWRSYYDIFKLKETSEVVVVLHMGTLDEDWYTSANPYLVLEPTSKIYKSIVEAHKEEIEKLVPISADALTPVSGEN